MRAEKAAREANSQRGMPAHTTTAEEVRAFVAKEKAEREAQGMDTSVLDALMAKEVAESKKSEWKRKRDEHERKSLEEGKSYGDLIMEQIWDVVSWGKGTAEEVKPADERQAAVQEAMREGSAKSVLTVLEVDGEKKEK